MAGEFKPSTKARIVHRAEGMCERCLSHTGQQIHHRRPRGMGGTKRVETATASNGVLVCSDCHAWIESNRQHAYLTGWLVGTYQMPADVPISIGGREVHLTDDGRYSDGREAQ